MFRFLNEVEFQAANNWLVTPSNKINSQVSFYFSFFAIIDQFCYQFVTFSFWKNRFLLIYKQLTHAVYNVFNVSQTNIKEARPELYQKLVDQNTQQRPEIVKNGNEFTFPAMDKMIAENKWVCPIKPTYGDDAYYSICAPIKAA